jgi:hypothetical protein
LHKKQLLGIILLIVILTVAICIVLNQSPMFRYEKSKSVIRNTDTTEEENALLAAENINYTDIFKVPRLSNPNLSDYSTETVANFIDAEVINYYDRKFESLKGEPRPLGIGLSYNANVSVWNEVHAVYISPPENESIYSAKVLILSSNDTILNEVRGGNGRYAYRNNSGIQEIQENVIDFRFLNCYVVEMELGYGETYGSLAAYFFNIYQTVIMDENFKPLFVCLRSYGGVS